MDNEKLFNYIENRAQSGYKSAIMVKKQDEEKYSLLIAGETTPSVYGAPNSFEFDLLNSPVIGKVQGKMTLEDKESEFLLHRDNIYRLEQLKGLTLDFMYVTSDFVGFPFTGTINYRPNDGGADILKGTYTVTPMSVEKPIYNVDGLLLETICFTDVVPDRITVGTSGITVKFPTSITGATLSVKYIDSYGNVDSATWKETKTNDSVKFEFKIATAGTYYGVALVTASLQGYASWTTTVALSGTKA